MFVASLWIFDCFGMFQETAKEPIEQYNLHNRRKSVSEYEMNKNKPNQTSINH